MAGTEPRPTKAQRRDEARLQAQKLREEQARKARRSRLIAISVLVAAIAAVAIVVAIILGNQTPASVEDATGPAGATESGGLPFDADGLVALNDEGEADVPEGSTVLSVYSDYLCPNCGQFEELHSELLAGLVEDGTIVYQYHLVSILDRLSNGTEYPTRAANAAATVADQDPDNFVAFHEALFANQPEENTDGLSDEEIAQIASDVGVPDDVVAQFTQATFTPWVAAETDQAAQSFDQFGTPMIVINGERWTGNWAEPGALEQAIEDAQG